MNKWNVLPTATFKKELRSIYFYIAIKLRTPENAERQIERITNEVESLDIMPMRYPLYGKKTVYGIGLRVLSVDNYMVFYLPDEKTQTVKVLHVMYSKRDINEIL